MNLQQIESKIGRIVQQLDALKDSIKNPCIDTRSLKHKQDLISILNSDLRRSLKFKEIIISEEYRIKTVWKLIQKEYEYYTTPSNKCKNTINKLVTELIMLNARSRRYDKMDI